MSKNDKEGFIMNFIKKVLKRYFVDAMSAMALGLFSSLIVGLIISQIAKIPHLDFLSRNHQYKEYWLP